MKKPDAATVAWYDDSVPVDPRASKGQMFGHPCAFVNGNMFFGTFENTLVARVGPQRAVALTAGGQVVVFEPMAGRAWKDYVQIAAGKLENAEIKHLAREALDNTAKCQQRKRKPRLQKNSQTAARSVSAYSDSLLAPSG